MAGGPCHGWRVRGWRVRGWRVVWNRGGDRVRGWGQGLGIRERKVRGVRRGRDWVRGGAGWEGAEVEEGDEGRSGVGWVGLEWRKSIMGKHQ